MDFLSTSSPPSGSSGSSWWFPFRRDKVLVEETETSVTFPYLVGLEDLKILPIRTQYLGELNGSSCYSAELPDDTIPPEGMCFLGLRELFERVEDNLFVLAGRASQITNWDRTHQFCSRCGAPIKDKRNERAKICPNCELVHYPRLSPAIIVAIVKEKKILLAHANRFPSKFYSVLAGFVEPGETFEECVEREVKEEVGIRVKNIRYFGSQPWPFPNSLMVGFTAEYDSGEIAIDDVEIQDAGWFPANGLPRIPGKISIARRLIDWFRETYP